MMNMMVMPTPFDRDQANRAIFDRSIPVAPGCVLRDKFAEGMIAKANEQNHFREFIPALAAAFPQAGIVVKQDHSDDQQVTIELRFPTDGWDLMPQVAEFLDAAEGRRRNYFRLVVS